MPAFHPITPEKLAEAKALYEDGDMPVTELAERLGLGLATFYVRVRIWGWLRRRRRRAGSRDLEAMAARGEDVSPEAARNAWFGERWEVDHQVTEKVRAKVEGRRPSEGERALAEAQTLYRLVRALRDHQAFEREQRERAERAARRLAEDAAEQERDRAELRRRIHALGREQAMRDQEAAALEAARAAPEPPPFRRTPARPRVIGF